METPILIFWTAALFVIQLLMCFRAKRIAVKLIPLLVQTAAVAACILGYGFSGWENWGFLILFILMLIPLTAAGFAWLLYGIVKFAQNAGK